MSNYFSDRELGPRARTEQTMSPLAWAGIVVLVEALANSGAFGVSFPQECPDGHAICGNDTDMLKSAIEAEIEGLSWPLQRDKVDEDDFMRTRGPWTPSTRSSILDSDARGGVILTMIIDAAPDRKPAAGGSETPHCGG